MVGAGAMGSVLGQLIGKRAHVSYWDKEPGKVPNQRPLPELAAEADIVFLCVVARVIRDAAGAIRPHLKKSALVITIAKGMEANGLTVDGVLAETLSTHQPFGLLSGPMLADELRAGAGGAAVVATKNKKQYELVRQLFVGSGLLLDYSADVRATALSGVLKNIYALSLGIAHGLGWGKNRLGWLVAQSLREIALILTAYDEHPGAAFGDAALADLVTTGFSSTSRNFQTGQALANATGQPLVSEGSRALPLVLKKTRHQLKQLPVLAALEQCFIKNKAARMVFNQFEK